MNLQYVIAHPELSEANRRMLETLKPYGVDIVDILEHLLYDFRSDSMEEDYYYNYTHDRVYEFLETCKQETKHLVLDAHDVAVMASELRNEIVDAIWPYLNQILIDLEAKGFADVMEWHPSVDTVGSNYILVINDDRKKPESRPVRTSNLRA